MEKKIKSKIEIELTEKEAGHLRTLLEGGIKISDSISQGEVFENILDHLNSQDQEEECRYFNGDEPIKDKETIEFMKGLPDRVWEDTPEEWEDRIRDLILDISADRLVSSEKVVAIVQSLLDDREREVVERIVRETRNMERLSIKQGIKGDKAMKRLRGLIESLYEYKLLNSKKK